MKHLTGFLALFLCAALPLYAADLSDLTYTTTGGEVTITDCDEAATGELVIPDSIGGNPVRSIGPQAFRECRSLASITIPDSVTSIGDRAFYNCAILASITIGDGVTSIGERAFLFCSSLTSVKIPDSVTNIGGAAFRSCTSLTTVTIGDGVTSIGDYTFYNCSSLTSVTIGNEVATMGEGAFSECPSLTNITFRGSAPTVNLSFSGVGDGATAYVYDQFANSFGGIGSTWEGLTVASDPASSIEITTITGSGTIEGVGSFANGSSITLTATPDAGYVFIAWTGDATGSENPLTLTVERDLNIGAIFIEPAAHGLVTQENFNEVVADRDARYTEDQIRALSPDYTMGLNEAGNVEVKISFIASSDATNFAPFSVTADSLTVVDGKICMELPPDQGAFFYRFRIE